MTKPLENFWKVMLKVLCSVLSMSFSVYNINAGIRKNTAMMDSTTPLASTSPISSPSLYDMNINATNEAMVVSDDAETGLKLAVRALTMASSLLTPPRRSCLKRCNR